LIVAVQLADRRNISPFALRLCAHGVAAFRALPSCLQLALVLNSRREGITPIAERDSPVRDSAGRVLPQHRVESFYGTAELEGMQQRYRPVEFLLRHFVARCGKVHRSQLLAIPMLVLLSEAARRQRQYKSRNDSSPDQFTPPALRIIDT